MCTIVPCVLILKNDQALECGPASYIDFGFIPKSFQFLFHINWKGTFRFVFNNKLPFVLNLVFFRWGNRVDHTRAASTTIFPLEHHDYWILQFLALLLDKGASSFGNFHVFLPSFLMLFFTLKFSRY